MADVPDADPIPEPQPEPAPSPDPRIAALLEVLDEAAQNPALAGAALGFCLVGSDGEILLDRHADIAQIPASSLKTLTTATALEILGPGFHFETRLGVSEATPDGSADLILVGGGDPMLSPDDLEHWAKALVEAGMQSVPGRVIGDGRHFAGSNFADFWNWGDIGNGYGSPVSGLNLGHNRFTAVFSPGEKEGDPAVFAGAFPAPPGVSWLNETRTGAEGGGDGVVIHGGERTLVMYLRGTVPLGGDLEAKGAVPDPERFAAHYLREALLAAGIVVKGEARGAGELAIAGETLPEIAKELLVHPSPPLLDIVRSIHETSDNHETECVYRTIGLQAGLPPEEAVRRHWQQRGLDLTGLRLVDGSGLARADHITPKTLARLQHLAATGPVGREYVDSLLSTAEGAIRFKAGAMSAVRSYAGLVETDSGRLAFALMVNHYADGAIVGELQRQVFRAMLGD
ncbi:MAG TPA: D-alanyl-D-alanine carboxypeptidase/D-alanyl-D-alanine-endopeptidase [Bacteroidia bacterium]|nr:D-alanyl-D-alanine carboxypeptidase/D-alanyl-D-alanine-endopeptidase [Bacteroidia bacterium]